MSDWQIGILGLIILFVLIPLRMHISVAMGLVAFVGIAFLNNINSAFGILSHTAFTNASSYMLAIIPMFMLMGEFANVSGLIREAYRIEGITAAQVRVIFLDWAMSRPEGADEKTQIAALLAAYGAGAPDHPMTAVLSAGLDAPPPPTGRRGGRKGRLG